MTSPPDDEPTSPLPSRRVGVLLVTAVVALALDVATKMIAVATLEDAEPVRLLGGGLYLVLVRNPGAAFNLGTGLTPLLSLIQLAVVVAIIVFAFRIRSVSWAIGLGLVLGGAMGNAADRLFRPPGPLFGEVIDFLSILAPDGSVWPVFNLADSAIVCGGILLVLVTLLGRSYDGSRAQPAERPSS